VYVSPRAEGNVKEEVEEALRLSTVDAQVFQSSLKKLPAY
jgi:hypothetical protein